MYFKKPHTTQKITLCLVAVPACTDTRNAMIAIKSILSVLMLALYASSMSGCSVNQLALSEEIVKKVKIEVRQSFDGLIEASKALDSKRYFDFFDNEKFVGLNSDGTNWNSIRDLEKIIEPSFNAVDRIQSFIFTNIQVSVIDKNTAILVNEYEQEVLLKSGEAVSAAGGGTQVWSKESGSWKIVSVSSSNKSTSSNE